MIVVKAGGAVGLDARAVCADVAALARQGEQVVLTHGGSHETNVISEKLGHPPRFVTSASGHVSRYSDRETLEIYAMVVSGRINTLLVEQLQQVGVNAFDGHRLGESTNPDHLRPIDVGHASRGDLVDQDVFPEAFHLSDPTV